MATRHRLTILTSHPIQYYAPLFRTLAAMHDIHVFYAHQASARQQAEAGFGVAFEWDLDLLSGYPSTILRNVAREPRTDRFGGCDTPDIAAALQAGGFTAVLTLGWHLKSFLQGILAAKRLGLPVLVRGDSQLSTPRSAVKRLAKRLTYPSLLRIFDAALYVGRNSRLYFEHYRYPADRLFFSPHCVDNARFQAAATAKARVALRARLGIASRTFVVLFAGKLVPFKRPLDVVEAIARASRSDADVALLLAGAGPLEADIRQAAARHDVRLHWLGFVNQSEMPAAYAASDALVLPSTGRETWGLVANESLAAGRPVILSDAVGSAVDLAGDGRAGAVFPVGDIDAFADRILAMVRDPVPLAAVREVADRFSLEQAAAGVTRALDHLRASRHPRPA